jgi:hypothetical protein
MATSDSEPNERRAFLRFARKAALLLPVLLLAPIVNFTVDPANLFATPGEEEAKIGDALLAGKNVVNFERYDDRRIAKYLLSHRTEKPDIVVLGSSRTLNMGSYLFPNRTVVNGSMLASTVREVLAQYAVIHGRKVRADTVIVGIDPWMLNADAYDSRWVAVQPEFDSALQLLGIRSWPGHGKSEENQSRLSALFSGDYFQQSIKSLGSREKRPKWYVSSAPENEGFTRLPDGSYTYSSYQRTKPQSATDGMADSYVAGKVYMLNEGAKVDSTHLYAIEHLLQSIRQDGSQPILYLPPYHPIVYAKLSADPQHAIVSQAEDALRRMAGKIGVPVVGSYNPTAIGLSNADFYDGHHLRESGLAKLFGGLSGAKGTN